MDLLALRIGLPHSFFQKSGTIEKALYETAFRWACCDHVVPIEDTWPNVLGPVAHINAFLNRHLWFLPIPRFDMTYSEFYQSNQETSCNADDATYRVFLATLTAADYYGIAVDDLIDIKDHKESDVYLAQKILSTLYPLIDVIRDENVSIEVVAYCCALLALDPKEARYIDPKLVKSSSFLHLAKTVLDSELGLDASCSHFTEYLVLLDRKLSKDALEYAYSLLEPAELTWISLTTAMGSSLLTAEQISQIDNKIDQMVEVTGLQEITLRQICYIESVVEEDLHLGYKL